jgi:hypothetical protein
MKRISHVAVFVSDTGRSQEVSCGEQPGGNLAVCFADPDGHVIEAGREVDLRAGAASTTAQQGVS